MGRDMWRVNVAVANRLSDSLAWSGARARLSDVEYLTWLAISVLVLDLQTRALGTDIPIVVDAHPRVLGPNIHSNLTTIVSETPSQLRVNYDMCCCLSSTTRSCPANSKLPQRQPASGTIVSTW